MTIYIKVKPGASRNEIIKKDENHWEVFVTVTPQKGKANKAVIDILAKELGVPKSRISIKQGLKSKLKAVEILNF